MAQGWDLEVTAADGTTQFGLSLAPTYDREGNQQPRTLRDVLVASDADAPLSQALESKIQEGWPRGVGLDYDWAPGVDTTDPDYACPAGAATDVTLPAGGAGGIAAIEEYGGDLWMLQGGDGTLNSARVLRLTGGVAPFSSSLTFAAGRYGRGMVVADDGSGNTRLYVMTSDSGTQNGAISEWDGATWTSTTAGAAVGASRTANGFGTNGRGPAIKVTWRGRDGIKNNAIVTKSGPKKISYTRPNADPMLGANWVEGVPIGTGYELIDLAAARSHVFFSARDNLFDLDEVGNTPGITSYIERQPRSGNGDAVLYMDGHIFYSTGDGLLMINVDQDGVVQEIPGNCAPGQYLPTINCPRGPVTAMCPDGAWVAASVFDTSSTRTSNVFYGRPSAKLGVDSPNPMVWHGPLLRIEGNYRVTRMKTSALSGLRLWVASIEDSLGTPRVSWMSRPSTGSTKWDQATGGTHRVTTGAAGGTLQPYARMYFLKETAGDKASRKDLHGHVYGTEGLSFTFALDGSSTNDGLGTKLVAYHRADAAPASTAWGTGVNVLGSPTYAIAPSTTVAGYATEQRIDFFAPSGGATPPAIPYLDSIRDTFWMIAPDTNVRQAEVVYGDVEGLAFARESTYSPDTITAWLQSLMSNGLRTVVRDPWGNRRTVRFLQSFDREVNPNTGGTWKKQIKAVVRFVDLGAA